MKYECFTSCRLFVFLLVFSGGWQHHRQGKSFHFFTLLNQTLRCWINLSDHLVKMGKQQCFRNLSKTGVKIKKEQYFLLGKIH